MGILPRVDRWDVIGDMLALGWADGGESFLPLRRVRDACPCATCAEGSSSSPPEARYRVAAIEPVGAYALCPRWGDGHSSGIYSFEYLRRLADHLEAEEAGETGPGPS